MHWRITQCYQHWMQFWATSLHIPLQLVLWWQNLSSRLYYLLWPLHYLQNIETLHLFSGMTFVVELPLLDVPSFWALVSLSWLWPSPCHPHQQQEVYSIVPWSPSQKWYRGFWLLRKDVNKNGLFEGPIRQSCISDTSKASLSTHTPKRFHSPTRWNSLSHHRLKQNSTTCCRFTQKWCFYCALSWRLRRSRAKGPLSAFRKGNRVYFKSNKTFLGQYA